MILFSHLFVYVCRNTTTGAKNNFNNDPMFANACLSFHGGSAQLFYKLLLRHYVLFAHYVWARFLEYVLATIDLRFYILVTLGHHIQLWTIPRNHLPSNIPSWNAFLVLK